MTGRTDGSTAGRAGTGAVPGDAAAGPAGPGQDAPTYERAREELADVVRRLEAGGLTLEESLTLWERGEQLAAICQSWLDGARAKLDAALKDRAERAADPPARD
jgi:exodeoxyribonuclease VII small subunit